MTPGVVIPPFLTRQGVGPLTNVIPLAEAQTPGGGQQLSFALAAFWRQLRLSRRPRMDRSGARVDGRRTFRDFVRNSGVLTQVHHHRRVRQRRLIVVVDCSETAFSLGLAVLVDAIRRVDSQIVLLGCDYEVQELRVTSVDDCERWWHKRLKANRDRGQRFLDFGDLPEILRAVGRLAPSPSQSYLLLVSDLLASGNRQIDASLLKSSKRRLLQYRKVWLVDSKPVGPPFREDEEGMVHLSGRDLRKLLDNRAEPLAAVSVRLSDGNREWQLSPSEIERLVHLGEQSVLFARRLTPHLSALGFVRDQECRAGDRLIYVPHNRCLALADIFREAAP